MTSVIASPDVRHLADLCDRLLWLDRGRVAAIGASHRVAEQYLAKAGAAEGGAAEGSVRKQVRMLQLFPDGP